MNNSIFVYSDAKHISSISKMHICIWKFSDMSTLLELGFLLKVHADMISDRILLNVYVPWLRSDDKICDLYEHLHLPENSKFIFNDKVITSSPFDGGKGHSGVILSFEEGGQLCLLPISFTARGATIEISIPWYSAIMDAQKCNNIYIRFYVQPKEDAISTCKPGIAKTAFIYDVRVNEQRNLPEYLSHKTDLKLCRIDNCYFLNIVPSVFDLTFLDLSCFKSARVLESQSFNDYIGSIKTIKKDELFVVFNKKKSDGNISSYSCFSIFTRERIGPTQIIFAFILNLLCGFLLFIPTYRNELSISPFTKEFYINLPLEVYLALSVAIAFVVYLVYPKLFKMRTVK